MTARLDQMTATRRRIAAATFELHATTGPARTTISAIAERAGVQRHTVYRHFPDMISLFEACTAHGLEVTRPPEAEAWRSIADPAERVRRGLGELYAYYRANARLMGNVTRDMPLIPFGVEGSHQVFELMESYFAALCEGWVGDPSAAAGLRATVGHALDFGTWRSLTTQGLSEAAAADAMTAFVSIMAAEVPDAGASQPGRVGVQSASAPDAQPSARPPRSGGSSGSGDGAGQVAASTPDDRDPTRSATRTGA